MRFFWIFTCACASLNFRNHVQAGCQSQASNKKQLENEANVAVAVIEQVMAARPDSKTGSQDPDIVVHFVDNNTTTYDLVQLGQRFGPRLRLACAAHEFERNGSIIQDPLIAVLAYHTESAILEFLQNLELTKYGHETVLMIAALQIFPTKERALRGTQMIAQFVGLQATVADAVCVVALYHRSPKITESVSVLIHEAYHIRDVMIAREVDTLKEMWPSQFLRRRLDFEGAHVVGLGVEDPHFEHNMKFRQDSEEFESGLNVDWYRYFRDVLKFSERSVKVNYTEYIDEGPGGVLVGFPTRLSTGEVDLGMSETEFVPYRMRGPDAIRILIPTLETGLYAFFVQPPLSALSNVYVQSFTPSLWAGLLAFCVSIGLAMNLIAVATAKQHKGRDQNAGENGVVGFLGTVATICRQGWSWQAVPTSVAAKLLALLTSLSALIFFTAFSGSLVSILSIRVVPVQNFRDLMTQQFEITYSEGVPSAEVILQAMEESNEIPPAPSGVREVQLEYKLNVMVHKRLAIVSTLETLFGIAIVPFSVEYICERIERVPVSHASIMMSPCVRRGSPLRGHLNFAVTKMIESGVRHRLMSVWRRRNNEVLCLEKASLEYVNLGFRDLLTAFVALVLGAVLSGVIILVETFYTTCVFK